jgi:hypothetical protein
MPRLDRGPGYRPGRTGRECGFAASIAHEVNQPLGAVVANAGASLRLLDGQGCIISDANRAADVIACIRALTKKTPFQKQQVDLNDVVSGRADAHRASSSSPVYARSRPDCLAGHVGLEVRRETGKE